MTAQSTLFLARGPITILWQKSWKCTQMAVLGAVSHPLRANGRRGEVRPTVLTQRVSRGIRVRPANTLPLLRWPVGNISRIELCCLKSVRVSVVPSCSREGLHHTPGQQGQGRWTTCWLSPSPARRPRICRAHSAQPARKYKINWFFNNLDSYFSHFFLFSDSAVFWYKVLTGQYDVKLVSGKQKQPC